MGRLVYAANTSLDGFVEDASGAFDWGTPGEDVHAFWNEHERRMGTALYGRRMYEAMRVWEDDDWLEDEPAVMQEYARIWRSADKVVWSTTLTEVTTARTRVERSFDPDLVRRLKESASSDLSVGGAALGAEAFRHGLVDEYVVVVHPVSVGAGKPALPVDQRVDLELVEQGRFAGGAVHLRYAVTQVRPAQEA